MLKHSKDGRKWKKRHQAELSSCGHGGQRVQDMEIHPSYTIDGSQRCLVLWLANFLKKPWVQVIGPTFTTVGEFGRGIKGDREAGTRLLLPAMQGRQRLGWGLGWRLWHTASGRGEEQRCSAWTTGMACRRAVTIALRFKPRQGSRVPRRWDGARQQHRQRALGRGGQRGHWPQQASAAPRRDMTAVSRAQGQGPSASDPERRTRRCMFSSLDVDSVDE